MKWFPISVVSIPIEASSFDFHVEKGLDSFHDFVENWYVFFPIGFVVGDEVVVTVPEFPDGFGIVFVGSGGVDLF